MAHQKITERWLCGRGTRGRHIAHCFVALLMLTLAFPIAPAAMPTYAADPVFAFPALLSRSDTFGVGMGDLNGDGALDLVLGNDGQPSQVYFNKSDRVGTFEAPVTLPESGAST